MGKAKGSKNPVGATIPGRVVTSLKLGAKALTVEARMARVAAATDFIFFFLWVVMENCECLDSNDDSHDVFKIEHRCDIDSFMSHAGSSRRVGE